MISKFSVLKVNTITSKNVSSEAQVKIFLFRKKVMFRSQDNSSFCVFNHPMIYQICAVMMSMST